MAWIRLARTGLGYPACLDTGVKAVSRNFFILIGGNMIDRIRDAVERDERLSEKPACIHSPSDYADGIFDMMDNPKAEEGLPLPWSSVPLTLKPETYLLTGIPSMGKSTWMDNIIVYSAQMHGYKWAVFSPESYPVKKYLAKLIWVRLGKNIMGKYCIPPTKGDVERELDWLSGRVVVLDPKESDKAIDSLLLSVEWLVVNEGINAFLFDPYNEFSMTRPHNITETEYVSLFLGRIRSFVNTHEVMAWIVAHPTKLRKEDVTYPDGTSRFDYAVPTAYDISGSANFYNKPDNIIAVHRNKDRNTNPDNIVQIRVWKARNNHEHEGEFLLHYNHRTNGFSSATEEKEGSLYD